MPAVTGTPKMVPDVTGITSTELPVSLVTYRFPAESIARAPGPFSPDAIVAGELAVTETPKMVPDAAGIAEMLLAVEFEMNRSPPASKASPSGALNPVVTIDANVFAATATPKILPPDGAIAETLLVELFAINKSPDILNASPSGPLNPEETTLASVLAVTETPKIVPEAIGITETLLPPTFEINKSPAESNTRPDGALNPDTIVVSVLAVTDTPKIVPEAAGITETVLAVLLAIKRSPAESNTKPIGALNPEEINVVKVLAVTDTPKIVPEAAGITVTVPAVLLVIKRSPAVSRAIPSGPLNPEETIVVNLLAVTGTPKIVPEVLASTATVLEE